MKNSNISEIDSATDLAQLCRKNQYVIVKWGASWCQPCKQMEPIYVKQVEAFAASVAPKNAVAFCSADIEVYKNSGVRSVPTVTVYDAQGNKIKSWVGFRDAKEVATMLKPYLYK
jgi:thiol:disulfide interchange protein